MRRSNQLHNKKRRQEEAVERTIARNERGDHLQLKRLDNMLGKDQGAKKERARLQANINRKELNRISKTS